MFQKQKILFLSAVTPMHVGSGSELGLVDLPIQREKHTGFPKIEGSSLKGAVREAVETQEKTGHEVNGFGPINKEDIRHLFGPEETTGHDDGYAGALGFTDARLFLFPVKSMQGVFAWITSPMVLKRLRTELEIAGMDTQKIDNALTDFDKHKGEALVPMDTKLILKDKKILLEEFAMSVQKEISMCKLAEWIADQLPQRTPERTPEKTNEQNAAIYKEKLVVLSDDLFRDFVSLSTEIITRTKINNETGTVAQGALFTEELLPAESILYAMVMAAPVFQKQDKKGRFKDFGDNEADQVMQFFKGALPKVMQIGGNATLGKGVVQAYII